MNSFDSQHRHVEIVALQAMALNSSPAIACIGIIGKHVRTSSSLNSTPN